MEARLNAIGIYDLLELKRYDKLKITKFLGRYGLYLWMNVNGIEISEVTDEPRLPKSIGHSYCIPKRTNNKKYLKSVFYKLTEKTGRRLREMGMEAGRINIFMSYVYEGGIGKGFKTSEKMFTTDEIFFHVEKFIDGAEILLPVRMAAISVSSLAPLSGQANLFYDNLKTKNLSLALDKINDKYGEYTVVKGHMFATDDMAKDRIGFRKIT